MHVTVFNECVERELKNPNEALILHGVTEDNSLFVACFDGPQGFNTLIATTGPDDNKVITRDPTPEIRRRNGHEEVGIAAIAMIHLWVVDGRFTQQSTITTRPACTTAVTVGLNSGLATTKN